MNNKEVIKVLQKRLNENAYYNRLTARKITSPYFKHNVLKYRLALLYAIKVVRDADNAADVLYICDHEACKRGITYGADACDPCGHTRNIRHAANFEPFIDNDGRILVYVEHAQKENPQGDLISREELKEATKSFVDCDGFNPVWQIIDNAPTVEQNWKFYYDHGYEQAKRDLKRPQGKWITCNSLTSDKELLDENEYYLCPFCHSKFRQKHDFCVCGADMRGGEAND